MCLGLPLAGGGVDVPCLVHLHAQRDFPVLWLTPCPHFTSDLLKDFVCRDGEPRVWLQCSEAHLLGEPAHGPVDLETDEVRPQFRARLVVFRKEKLSKSGL